MHEFHVSSKNDTIYLDCAANGNGNEKSLLTGRALQRLHDAKEDKVHVVEIGPGGGAALTALSAAIRSECLDIPEEVSISFVELDGVESDSLKRARQDFSDIGTSEMVQGNAMHLDSLLPKGANVVAASAVLHEVYSYSGGYSAVDSTISAITRTLQPNGFFAYRDVFSVERSSQHERAKHVYDRESWVRFSQMFLPHYLGSAEHPYHREDDKVIFEQDSRIVASGAIDPRKYLSITAPIGLLRELQRHYITFRDYTWRHGALGITPVLEGREANDWLDMKKGHKRVHYETDLQDRLLETMSEDAGDGLKVVDGDMFDATTDVLLGRLLRGVAEGEEGPSSIWKRWLEREGSETYVYMTIGRLLGAAAITSLEASQGEKVLLPVTPDDVLTSPRAYYNRYLQGHLSNPLYDGKQLVLFKAVNPEEDTEQIVQSLEVLSEHCTRETIARIYEPIRKVIY